MKKFLLFCFFVLAGFNLNIAQADPSPEKKTCVCHRNCNQIVDPEPICVSNNSIDLTGLLPGNNHGKHICKNQTPGEVFDVIGTECSKKEDCGTCSGGGFSYCPDLVTVIPFGQTAFDVCPVCPDTTPPVFVGPNGACPQVQSFCPDGSLPPNGDLNLCPCDHGDCTQEHSKTFDFDVQMGGVQADMYVCEVGFHQLCPTCNQHYLTLDGGTTKITTFQTFTKDEAPTKAQVYINDLFFGAEFYVKYCVKTKRLIVGDLPAAYTAVITPSATIWTGLYNGVGANDYVTISQLGANVYADCESGLLEGNSTQGTLLTPNGFTFSSTTTSAVDLPPSTVESCGNPGCDKNLCVYTLRFNEQATCYRPFKCVDGVCTPYESTIHTKFDAGISFNCDNGICED